MAARTRKAPQPRKNETQAQFRTRIQGTIPGYADMTPGLKAAAFKRAVGMDLSAVAAKAVASKGKDGLLEAAAKAVSTRKANAKPAPKPRAKRAPKAKAQA